MWSLTYRGFVLLGSVGTTAVQITGVPHGTGTKQCADINAAKLYIQKLKGF